MNLQAKQIAYNWIDDQLDLYNLAVRLEDAEWQQQILARLQQKDSIIREEIHIHLRRGLWERFEAINNKMLGIYRQIRENANQAEQRSLREKAWELKRERVRLGKQLRKVSDRTG